MESSLRPVIRTIKINDLEATFDQSIDLHDFMHAWHNTLLVLVKFTKGIEMNSAAIYLVLCRLCFQIETIKDLIFQ